MRAACATQLDISRALQLHTKGLNSLQRLSWVYRMRRDRNKTETLSDTLVFCWHDIIYSRPMEYIISPILAKVKSNTFLLSGFCCHRMNYLTSNGDISNCRTHTESRKLIYQYPSHLTTYRLKHSQNLHFRLSWHNKLSSNGAHYVTATHPRNLECIPTLHLLAVTEGTISRPMEIFQTAVTLRKE